MTAFEYHIWKELVDVCMAGLMCLMLGGILYGEGVTIEFSADVGGRVIWPGSLRDKRPYGGIDYKEIYGPKQIFY